MDVDSKKKRLDVLLISPPIFYDDSENIWKKVNSNFPPLGLASIAGYIRDKGNSVKIIDCNIDAPSIESFKHFFQQNIFDSYWTINYIGITAMTSNIKKAYKISEICKEYFPDAKIIFGGVHATSIPREVINNKHVDVVVVGEGEVTFEEIVSGKKLRDIKGILFKTKGKSEEETIQTPPRERILDLDSIPMPAYDLLPIRKYRPAKGTYKRLPAMSMITSRGCPGRCTFCNKTLGNRLVFKSAEKIFKEILYLIKNFNIKQILFYDDTFTVNKNNVMKLCELLIKNKVDISWTCFARVDFVDFKMLQSMKEAGCHQIMYGVENIDETVLNNINKKISLEQVVRATNLTKRAGIECRLAFMVGNPGDSIEIVKKNIKFVNKLNPDLLIVNITTPFPGTAMFRWAKEKNLILTYDWDDYTLAKPVMRLENLTSSEIKDLYKMMYREFYFRPSYFFKKLVSIRSMDDLKILVEGFKAVFSFIRKKK